MKCSVNKENDSGSFTLCKAPRILVCFNSKKNICFLKKHLLFLLIKCIISKSALGEMAELV